MKQKQKTMQQVDRTIASLVEESRPRPERLNIPKAVEVQPEFVSVLDAEVLSGISRWTWRQLAYQRRISSCKLGRRLLLPLCEIRELIAEGMRHRLPGRVSIVRTRKSKDEARA
jgi:hypothetical protein